MIRTTRSTRTTHAARTRTRRSVARAALGLVAAGTTLGLTAPLASAASAPDASSSDRAIIAVAPSACDGSVMPGERAGIIAVRPGERGGIIAVIPAPSCPG